MTLMASRSQDNAVYNAVRAILAEQYELMEYPEPNYIYTLHCAKCGKYRKHLALGTKETTVRWVAEGEPYESTAERDWYRCSECGTERAFGISAKMPSRRFGEGKVNGSK